LDVEWAGAVARGANILLVVSPSTNTIDGIPASLKYIVDNNLAPVVSSSYIRCEAELGSFNNFFSILWQQAAAQGISAFSATGDAGSAGCDNHHVATIAQKGLAVNGYSSSPYVTAVGGTMLGGDSAAASNQSGTSVPPSPSYVPESVWNESYYSTTGFGDIFASGGGVSIIYPKPAWQTAPGVPAGDPGIPSLHHRYLPDVSLPASGTNPYYVLYHGGVYGSGGTSVSSPAFSGLAAILNQFTGTRNGSLNPRLYSLASQVPGVFHDVTSGTNAVPCAGGSPDCSAASGVGTLLGYPAGPGYDLATGLGSVDAYAMIFNWQGPPVPTLTSVTFFGAAVIRGRTMTGSFLGSHFSTLATVNVNNPGITVSTPSLFNSSILTADFAVAPNTPPGTYNVSITTPAGTSNTVNFTVSAQPVIDSISPATALIGTETPLTITGVNFTPDSTLSMAGTGVTFSNVRVLNANTITATLSLTTNANPGSRSLFVNTYFGYNSANFTVLTPTPALISISPAQGAQGATLTLTAKGTNFASPGVIYVAGTGVTAYQSVVQDSSTITATLVIDPKAAVGTYAVRVQTFAGTTGSLNFTVTPPPPVLLAILPSAGVQGTTQQVSVFGNNLAGATVNVSGSGIAASGITILGPASGTVTFTIAPNATLGVHSVTLSNAGGTSAASNFTVGLPAPTLTGISPATGVRGGTVNVTLTGSSFAAPATVGATAIGVAVSNVTVVSSTTITATFTMSANATTGGHLVTVTTPGGTSGNVTFTVNPSTP
jgi:subtilase family serine protease